VTHAVAASRWRRALLVAAALAGIDGAAAAASFDCHAATLAPVDKRVCAGPVLSALDAQLAAAYRLARAQAPEVTAEQRTWIATRRDRCADDASLFTAYVERLAALRARTHACPLPEPALLGEWVDADPAGGPFDSVAFSRDGARNAFDSWLHQAPFASGSWTFKDCGIHVDAAAGNIDFDCTILDFERGVLRLASDLDDRPIALKRVPKR